MKLIITGGAGFIGSTFVKKALDLNFDLMVVDKLTYASDIKTIQNFIDNKDILFEKIDISDFKGIKKIFNFNPDKIIHFAAESHVDQSINSPDKFINSNIIGTYNLLQNSLSYFNGLNINKKNNFLFYHVSTDEVFGDLQHPQDKNYDPMSNENYFHEKSPYKPSSPYSASKAASDHLVRAWYRTYKLPIMKSNCSNNYGPNQHSEKLIPHVVKCALDGSSIPVYGNGNQIRDWLHVEDHVDAIINLLSFGKIGDTYNIGARCEVSNIILVKNICDILDNKFERTADISFSNQITFVNDRKGHDKRYAIDPSKIEQELNWKPKIPFKDGLESTIEFYIKYNNN